MVCWVPVGCSSLQPYFPRSLSFSPYLNPNWTGWGQSWPRRLRPPIAWKLIKYLILKNTYSSRNVFQIFLNFWHDLKEWHFDVLFDVFLSEVWLQRHPSDPPFRLVLLLLQTTIGAWEVRLGCGLQSSTAPVRIAISFRPWAVESAGGGLGSQSAFLLRFLSGPLVPRTDLGKFPKPADSIAQWHIIHAAPFEEVNRREEETKRNGEN
jgi:hypothetical protein